MTIAEEQIRPFLEKRPLYFKETLNVSPLIYEEMLYPEVLELVCPQCGQSRPFRRQARRQTGPAFGRGITPILDAGVLHFVYDCTGCTGTTWRCWVELSTSPAWIRKVGQLPPWSIGVSTDLARHL